MRKKTTDRPDSFEQSDPEEIFVLLKDITPVDPEIAAKSHMNDIASRHVSHLSAAYSKLKNA